MAFRSKEEEKRIKSLWQNKKITRPFEEFHKWHTSQEHKCHYCGITEAEIHKLFEAAERAGEAPLTKRGRGRHLELERKEPNKSYDDLDNLTFACYWCNNAKTDTFTAAEFKKVGQVFAQIWQDRLNGSRGGD
jgi:5-methylcytosine-specific restriction endonuclease McrA